MASTKTPSTSRLSLMAAVVAVAVPLSGAYAQGQGAPSPSSKAQKLEWPRTFSGQPDFAFTREEAVVEARVRATRENEPMPIQPSLEQLVNDDSVLDPLRINSPQPTSAQSSVSGTEASSSVTEDVPSGPTLMERLMSQASDLPTVAPSQKPDLTEFSARLSATISSTVANWQPSGTGYDFQSILNKLVLQAIVTSPVKYAVINQQRYMEGETFRITVPLQVPDYILIRAARAQMPPSGTLTPALQEDYEAAYTAILAGFNAKRNQSPQVGQQTLILPVRITAITARQVLLEMEGKPYALSIRYAY